jgi:protein-S-isoprenylcysteine O-methyltransferase Ste14
VKKDIAFVLIQFVLFGLYIVDFSFIDYSTDIPVWAKLLLAFVGLLAAVIITMGIINLNDNLTPFPTPRKNARLISHGIYTYIRHPIYTGIILIMLAYGLFTASLARLIISIILLIVFYFKSKLEEKLLIEKFPEYKDYKKSAGRFLPRFRMK